MAQLLRPEIKATEVGAAIFITEPAPHGILDRFGLLVDLLEHEMLELALIGVARIPVDLMNTRIDMQAVVIDDMPFVWGKHAQLTILEINHLVGVPQKVAGIAGQELFALTDTEYKRTAQAGTDDQVGKAW